MPTLKRTRTGAYGSRARIPEDVKDEYGRRFGQRFEAKFSAPASFRPDEAQRLFAEWLAEHRTRVATIRAERTGHGSPLAFKQAHELAAEWYRWFTARREDNPGPPER